MTTLSEDLEFRDWLALLSSTMYNKPPSEQDNQTGRQRSTSGIQAKLKGIQGTESQQQEQRQSESRKQWSGGGGQFHT